jgi:hypothetical protein
MQFGKRSFNQGHFKNWTPKDKDKDQTLKDKDKDEDPTCKYKDKDLKLVLRNP